jgi:hypothetical protein
MSLKQRVARLSVVAVIGTIGGSALAMPASPLCDEHGKDSPKDESSSSEKNDKKDAPKEEPKPVEKAPS